MTIHYNCYADAETVLTYKPDTVIVATGGTPDTSWINDETLITSAWDILSGQVPAAENAIVYDGTGRHAAATAAEALIEKGTNTQLFSIDDHFGMELAYAEQTMWRKRLYKIKLPIEFNQRLLSVERDNNRLTVTFRNELTNEVSKSTTDQLVVEHGTTPAEDLFLELQPLSLNSGVIDLEKWVAGKPQPLTETPANAAGGFHLYRIGDAISSRNIHTAILDAHRLVATM